MIPSYAVPAVICLSFALCATATQNNAKDYEVRRVDEVRRGSPSSREVYGEDELSVPASRRGSISGKPGRPDHQHGRVRRELTSVISDLASSFFNRGGQQGVQELDNSNDKMSVLKRYLGSAIVGAVFGNGNDLVSSILGSWGGKGNSQSSGSSSRGSGSGGYVAPSSGGSYSPVSTNSKTGVSVIDSRPGERRPSSPSNRGNDGDGDVRRGSQSSRDEYGEDELGVSPSRRGSVSGNRDTSYPGNTVNQPQSGSSSKTGVSIIDSRPGDRKRRTTTGARSRDQDYNNRDTADYENGGPEGSLGGSENVRGETDRNSGSRRGSTDDTGSRFGSGRRTPSGSPDLDSY